MAKIKTTTTTEFSVEEINNLIREKIFEGKDIRIDYVIQEVDGDPLDRYRGRDEVTAVRVTCDGSPQLPGSLKPASDERPALVQIATERRRQIESEGWNRFHDDKHTNGEMAVAASCYAMPPEIGMRAERWPWNPSWWKPTPDDRIRELVKAGALIVAEIERLQRVASEADTNDDR